jgi:hypothetical protein
MRLLLKVPIAPDMLRVTYEDESNVMTATITWGEILAVNARYFVICGVMRIVNDFINSRSFDRITGLEFISCVGHV